MSCIINLVYKIIKSWNLKIEMNIIGDWAPHFKQQSLKIFLIIQLQITNFGYGIGLEITSSSPLSF